MRGSAAHATQRGIVPLIVMPPNAARKGHCDAGFAGEVYLRRKLRRLYRSDAVCKETGMTFIHPFDDPLVMARQP